MLNRLKKLFGAQHGATPPRSESGDKPTNGPPSSVPYESSDLLDAVSWVIDQSTELWDGQREEVLALVSNPYECGPVIRFTSPTVGFVAAASDGIIQVMSIEPVLTPTLLPYASIANIVYAPLFTETDGAVAFTGMVDGEDVAVSALIDSSDADCAEQLIKYVSVVTGIAVDIRSHDNP